MDKLSKEFKSIHDIDIELDEGKLLCVAMGMLMCVSGYTNKAPTDILRLLVESVNTRTNTVKEVNL